MRRMFTPVFMSGCLTITCNFQNVEHYDRMNIYNNIKKYTLTQVYLMTKLTTLKNFTIIKYDIRMNKNIPNQIKSRMNLTNLTTWLLLTGHTFMCVTKSLFFEI